jgi:hypothetical protein
MDKRMELYCFNVKQRDMLSDLVVYGKIILNEFEIYGVR